MSYLQKIILKIFLVIIVILILSKMFVLIGSSDDENKYLVNYVSKEATVKFDETGKLIITDKIELNVNDVLYSKRYGIRFPLTIINSDIDETILTTVKRVDSILVNGKSLLVDESSEELKKYYVLKDDDIYIGNFIFDNIGKNTLEYTYTCENYNIITNYNDCTTLKFKKNIDFNNYTINLLLPKKTDMFKIKNKNMKLIKEEGTNYICNLKQELMSFSDDFFEILIDSDVFNSGRNENTNFYLNHFKNLVKSNNLDVIFKEELILLVIVLLIFTKNIITVNKKAYVRDVNDVIDPILAESIIDRKIGASELLMSCIVNLIDKGNIEVINNDNLKLVHKQNISEYENDIINLVFAGNKEIAFSKIKIMFVNNTYSTATFYGRFKIIKEKITKALYDKKIFDSNFKFILNIIKVLSIKIYLNLFCAFIGIHELFSLGKYYNLVLLVIAIVIAVFGFDRLISWLKESDEGTIPLVMCTGLYLAIFIATSDFNFIYILSVAFLFIFNTYIYQKSQQHIFTKYGRLEYIKIYGLKKYIEDYSLIKNRDLESVIIWDKYLAYAVAFDIPNKVMKQFDEGLLNTNIMLQKIDNILKF
ncbi:MAG: DUF2207 domain-containing protein [Clostridia bacterium]|nr:DUF2207 domain-containing protein [Clostridia bacterium]